MSGALSKNLHRFFFLPISTSRINEPIIGFYGWKCFTSLNKSLIGFWFFIMFFGMGLSLHLKLASFSHCLLRTSQFPTVSLCQTRALPKQIFLHPCSTSSCWKSLSWKSVYHQTNPFKKTQHNCWEDCSIFLFLLFYVFCCEVKK